MPQLSNSAIRVVDPILSTVAQGYVNAKMVGDKLFPYVPVDTSGGKIITFGKEDFLIYNTARAPGSNTKRIQFGYSGNPYALESHSLEGLVPYEHLRDAAAVPGINLAQMAIVKVQNIITLRLEKAQADLARTASLYATTNKKTLTGTAKWTDPGSDPIADIDTACEAIRTQIGMRPNSLTIGPAVFVALKNHAKILDRIKYTSSKTVTTEVLASIFTLDEVNVGNAVYNDGTANKDVWGNDAILACTVLGSLADMGTPAYGYTYRLREYPMVEAPYTDRNAKSWIYPVNDEVAPVIAGASAGYLFVGAA